MKKITLLFISLFLASCVYGQSAYLFDATAANTKSNTGDSYHHYAPPLLSGQNTVNIEDAFFKKGWHKGYAILNDSVKSNVALMAYSLHTNELLFIDNSKKHTVSATLLNGFVFTGPKMKATFKNGFFSKKYDITANQMMRVIYDGGVQLLAKETSEWDLRPGGASGQKRYQFFPKTTFFLVKSDNFSKITLREHDILKVLNNHRQEIKNYAASNDLTFNKEADLTKILSHFDTIQAN